MAIRGDVAIRGDSWRFALYASQAAKSVSVVTPPGINEAVLRLYCVHNFDNQYVNYDFVNDRGPM